VTADPEVRALPSGQRVANFSIATNRRYTDSAGVQQDVPEYHNIALFGKLAEIAEQYVKK
jgi:single-strand DNA-binding protein